MKGWQVINTTRPDPADTVSKPALGQLKGRCQLMVVIVPMRFMFALQFDHELHKIGIALPPGQPQKPPLLLEVTPWRSPALKAPSLALMDWSPFRLAPTLAWQKLTSLPLA